MSMCHGELVDQPCALKFVGCPMLRGSQLPHNSFAVSIEFFVIF